MPKIASSVMTRERDFAGVSVGASADLLSTLTAASATWRLKTVKTSSENSIATAADMNATLQP